MGFTKGKSVRLLLIFFFCLNFSYAHKLNVFLQQEDTKVFVSSYYASGSFCKNCKVEVLNKSKQIMRTGITNNKGEFVIDVLDTFLYGNIEAKGGHKVENSIKIENIQKDLEVNKKLEGLMQENKKLKREIEILKEKNSLSDLFKMIIALLVIVFIFYFLKRVKK